MKGYEHTQHAPLLRVLIWIIAVAVGGGGILSSFRSNIGRALPLLLTSVLLAGLAILFDTLTVKVSRTYISIKFGIGIIRKKFAVSDAQNAAIVRNGWYYGWGIRLTPHGWLYNVSGLDAVEIQLRNGRKFRIGTDEPVELLAAVQAAILQQSGENENSTSV